MRDGSGDHLPPDPLTQTPLSQKNKPLAHLLQAHVLEVPDLLDLALNELLTTKTCTNSTAGSREC